MLIAELLRFALTAREWNVGLVGVTLEDLITAAENGDSAISDAGVSWLKKPWFVRSRADPFLLKHEGRLFLFYEELLGFSKRGRLCVTQVPEKGGGARSSRAMLRLPCHASYPYVFEHAGGLYCIPETADCQEVALYRSEHPFGPWRKQCTLLSGEPLLDCSIIGFSERWWLFCSIRESEVNAYYPDLLIFHASDIEGPWKPHALRPAKTDSHSARPAGRPFVVDGTLYRPGQDCLPRYGGRVAINRVLVLSPEEFEEETCCFLQPDSSGQYRKGLHTVTQAGGIVAIDGLRTYLTLNPYKVVSGLFGIRARKLGWIRQYQQQL